MTKAESWKWDKRLR